MSTPTQPKLRFNVLLDLPLIEALKRREAECGCSKSESIRRALAAYLMTSDADNGQSPAQPRN